MTKYLNKNIDTSRSGPPKSIFVRDEPKVHPVRFVDPYDHIDNTDSKN